MPKVSDIANIGGHSESYVRTRLQLAFLAPDIQMKIMDGSQPSYLTLEKIVRTGVPLCWKEQAEKFGFSEI